MTDLAALQDNPESITLASGTTVMLEDLRARQFFKLLRIISHGALPLLREQDLFTLNADTDPGQFAARLLSVLLLAIPDAEDETIEFLQSMLKPAGLIERRGLDKADTARNEALWLGLYQELGNPELDDMVTLIEAIVRREAADIQALGKRLAGMVRMASQTGQLPAPSSATTSSAASPASSTSSPANTGGATSTSRGSASRVSASASRRSGNVATTSSGRGNSN